MTVDEKILRDIVKKAIDEGKLFDLVFTEDGRRLWKSWPEERFKRIVREEIRKSTRRR